MTDFDISEDLSINRYQLDLEAISLPSLYFRYADAVREAKEIVSEKQDMLDAIIAETNINIRELCAQNGTKVTEGIVSAKVETDDAVKVAKAELREAKATLGRLQVAVSALEVKKNEIDNLVKLYCSSYYTNKEPTANTDFKNEMIAHEMKNGTRPIPVRD